MRFRDKVNVRVVIIEGYLVLATADNVGELLRADVIGR